MAVDLVVTKPSASAPEPAAPGPSPAPPVGSAPAPVGASPTSASDGPSTEFRPVVGGGETKSGEALLVGSYATIWVLVLLFVVSVWRRNRSLEDRLARVEKALASEPNGINGSSSRSSDPAPPTS